MTDKDKKNKKGKEEEEEEEERVVDVTSIIMDIKAVENTVKKLVRHPNSYASNICDVLTSVYTSAKSISRSPDPIPSNGIVSVPAAVCALLFNKYSEGIAEIRTRYKVIRTGPEGSGWCVIAVEEGDDIAGFAQFYYYYKL